MSEEGLKDGSTVVVRPSSQLSYLTDVDHVDHQALVAEEPGTGSGVGVARFIRLEDAEVAEVAVAVADEWQNRGVRTVLLRRLTERAREEGVRRFRAEVLAENQQMLRLLDELGVATRSGVGAPLSGTLKAAASGTLRV